MSKFGIPQEKRQLLPNGYIESMPFKDVSRDELDKLMCEWDFNPPIFYQDVAQYKNEVGYDQLYRYLLKE